MKDPNNITVGLDVGDNVVSLVEKPAAQIGTTADKVFPWYVQQQLVGGWVWIIIYTTILIIGCVLFFIYWKKADFKNGNLYLLPAITGLIFMVVGTTYIMFGIIYVIPRILNPNYYAFRLMISDIAKLLGN